MTSGAWREVIGPRDRVIYAAAGYGERVRPGSRPVLLVIDVTYGFVGREPADILTAIETYPNACGEAGWAAVATIERLLPAARPRAVSGPRSSTASRTATRSSSSRTACSTEAS